MREREIDKKGSTAARESEQQQEKEIDKREREMSISDKSEQ